MGFDQFWDAWRGRKVGKKQAKAQWDRLKPDAELEQTILAAIAAQAEERRLAREALQFMEGWLHPHRWIRDRRWEDELLFVSPSNPSGPHDIWQQTLAVVRSKVDNHTFRTWFRDTTLVRSDRGSVTVCVAEYAIRHYRTVMESALHEVRPHAILLLVPQADES